MFGARIGCVKKESQVVAACCCVVEKAVDAPKESAAERARRQQSRNTRNMIQSATTTSELPNCPLPPRKILTSHFWTALALVHPSCGRVSLYTPTLRNKRLQLTCQWTFYESTSGRQ